MGKTRWEPSTYAAVDKKLKDDGVDPFAYSQQTMQNNGSVHESLDASKGGPRLSQDFDGIEKTSITVAIDVTGSGRKVPAIVRDDLPQLMGLLSVQGYVQHPDIQVIGFGDTNTDTWPLQVAQFESDIRIDENLRNLVLEGNGGGQNHESYELVMWYAAHMNRLDSWKRGKKGFLFMIGDELAYPMVKLADIKQYIGDSLDLEIGSTGLSLENVVQDVLAKYHVYYIICGGSQNYGNPHTINFWKELIGEEQVIQLPDPKDISEMIASIVGYMSGVAVSKIQTDLVAMGSGVDVYKITKTLALLDPNKVGGIMAGGTAGGSSLAERL